MSDLEVTPVQLGYYVDLKETSLPIEPAVQKEIDAIWSEEKRRRPHLFNGQVLGAVHFDAQHVEAVYLEYKTYLACARQPDLFEKTGAVSMAVSGITLGPHGILFGKRSDHVASFSGAYELAPAGSLEGADYRKQIFEELKEETGLTSAEIESAIPILLIHDKNDHILDICIELTLKKGAGARQVPNEEYEELFWVPFSDLPTFCQEKAAQFIPTTRAILQHRYPSISIEV